jgi:CRISP-associated protein Cas1
MIKRTLYFGNPAVLKIKDKQLVIETETYGEKNKVTVPVEDIGVVILDNQQIMASQRVFQLLLENNTCIMFCGGNHMPQGLLLPFEGNTLQSERYRCQIESSLPLKKHLWQQTVVFKIRNQAKLLEAQDVPIKNMLHWASQVNSGDTSNYEARAAAYYWDNIFNQVFKRHRYGFPPNNLLNYGYAILRAVVARALVGSGLLPTLGIHHRNKYNAFCLADDIMEPYRPYVDKVVLEILNENDGEIDELTPILKRKLLLIPAMDVFIAGQKSPLMLATQRTSASLSKCFEGETRKIIFPELHI